MPTGLIARAILVLLLHCLLSQWGLAHPHDTGTRVQLCLLTCLPPLPTKELGAPRPSGRVIPTL